MFWLEFPYFCPVFSSLNEVRIRILLRSLSIKLTTVRASYFVYYYFVRSPLFCTTPLICKTWKCTFLSVYSNISAYVFRDQSKTFRLVKFRKVLNSRIDWAQNLLICYNLFFSIAERNWTKKISNTCSQNPNYMNKSICLLKNAY